MPRRPPAGCASAPAARRVCKCPGEREALPQGVLPTSTTDSDGPPGGTSTPTAARRLTPAACRVCECPDRRGALPHRRAANLATSTDSDGPPGVQVPRRPLAGCASAPAAHRVCEGPDDRGAQPRSVLPASTHTTDSDGPPGGASTPAAACRVCMYPSRPPSELASGRPRGATPKPRRSVLPT